MGKDARSLLVLLGKATSATKALLAVAYVLEKLEDMYENNKDCFLLLKEIFLLAKLLKPLEENPKAMQHFIKNGANLIRHSAYACLSQIGDDNFSK